jgi:plasmid maintenance system killer protein
MITNFKSQSLEEIWTSGSSPLIDTMVQKRIYRKLLILNSAHSFDDLRVLFAERLIAARGIRTGQFIIGSREKYYAAFEIICFSWQHPSAYDVELVNAFTLLDEWCVSAPEIGLRVMETEP